MGAKQQVQLDGAYYGPSIPPPSKSRRRSSRHGGGCCCCCCCNLFGCLLDCICTCIWQIICTLLVIAAIIIFILWLILRPNNLEYYASNASLTEFNRDGNTLRYNMTLNLTISNPNERIGVHYEGIEAVAFYQEQRFAAQQLEPFYLERNATHSSSAEFKGQNLVSLDDEALSKYYDEKSSGVYGIDVRLYLRIRLKFGFIESSTVKPLINCDINVPLSSSRKAFESQKCDYDWR